MDYHPVHFGGGGEVLVAIIATEPGINSSQL